MTNLKRPTEILASNQSGTLQLIYAKAAQLTTLNKIWRTQIDETLAQHTQVANYREGCLVIEVSSPVWATRLRYGIPDLLQKLRALNEFAGLTRIEWYVKPA